MVDHPEEERHTKLPEETIKIKIKNSIEEKDTLRGVRNHTVEAVVKLGGWYNYITYVTLHTLIYDT